MSKKLKIVQVIPSLQTGGAERLVLDITNQLEKLGHQVHIILFRPENDFPKLSKAKRIEVIPSQVSYSITGKDIIISAEFDNRIRDLKPDIIHSHLLEAEFVSRHNPLPDAMYITHWHGCHPPTNPHRITEYMHKDAWWHLYSIYRLKQQYKTCNNQFLCISEFIRKYVARALKPESKNIKVIPNGCNLSQFNKHHLSRKNNQFTLISVGSFHPYKNQRFILEVLRHIITQGVKDVCIRFLGDGVERQNLELYVQEHNLSDYVEFLGYVDDPGLHMASADILVHAALNEPFGLIFLEAMSAGLPIVAFHSGGIPEVVEHNKTGLLVEEEDLSRFSSAILKLKNNPSLLNAFSLEGIRTVQKFDLAQYVKKIEDLYFDLLSSKQIQ